jgi:hypothetical protein
MRIAGASLARARPTIAHTGDMNRQSHTILFYFLYPKSIRSKKTLTNRVKNRPGFYSSRFGRAASYLPFLFTCFRFPNIELSNYRIPNTELPYPRLSPVNFYDILP